ncbi:MAG: bifunctional hydroxymethylpyrimidine kinase/phosphomethylpyrimidine kinase [Gemmatimonadales bacterium]
MKIALTIAGSDSGGGAGIQADLKTFQQFGVFGTSVVVAVTAQNTKGVQAIHAVPGEVITAQLDAIADDLPPQALKTGMLADSPTVELVAEALRRHRWSPYVLDPVMVATSGDRLQTDAAADTLRQVLLPLATVVTPNTEEASRLTGIDVGDETTMMEAGRTLLEAGAGAVLVTGGHLTGDTVVDVLVGPDWTRRYANPRIETRSTHGTGCTLSAAITANLALGHDVPSAVDRAVDFVHRAIASAPGLGSGHGPLNHNVPADPA